MKSHSKKKAKAKETFGSYRKTVLFSATSTGSGATKRWRSRFAA